MTKPTEEYTEEFIRVRDLEVDSRVQRHHLNRPKVQELVRDYNPAALGLVHVSRRATRANIILDGMHRTEATRIITDNEGSMWCRVFTGLTLAQEAQMFLDLNRTSAPSLIDKFNVLLSNTSDEGFAAQEVARIVGEYGWKVARTAGPGNVNAVRVLQLIYNTSVAKERDPNILQLTIMAITSAWGTTDRVAVEGSMLQGVAAIFDEYGSTLDVGRFITVLQEVEGGPVGLLARATQFASMKKSRRSMAVAELLVEAYNKGLSRRGLSPWRRRA